MSTSLAMPGSVAPAEIAISSTFASRPRATATTTGERSTARSTSHTREFAMLLRLARDPAPPEGDARPAGWWWVARDISSSMKARGLRMASWKGAAA